MELPAGASAVCLFVLLLCIASPEAVDAGSVGLCYGRNADNLPSPQTVAQLLVKETVTKVRIYDYNASVIQAFAGTNIELIVTIPNEELSNFQAEGPADQWVNNVILPLLQSVKITVVTVGVEVPILHPNSASLVLPAMQNVHTGLTKAGLSDQIKVSTAHSMAILKSSFPPSTGAFNDSLATSFVGPILDFLKATGSFYMVNAYPFHAYMSEMDGVALDYALFEPKDHVVDPNTNLSYYGLLLAQVDAVYFAMEALGHGELSVLVSETGWPRGGDSDEAVANVQNAATYNNNLLMLVQNNTGTPHRTGHPLDAYIFSIFDEDKKPGKGSERHWGVFDITENSFYYLDLNDSDHGAGPAPFNGTGKTWCVALPSASNERLQVGLNYACGKGNADCDAIQQGEACFLPNTYVNHASYAYNSYYQRSGDNAAACDFGGTATITTQDPSYGSCVFQADSTAANSNSISGCCTHGLSSSWRTSPNEVQDRWLFVFSLVLLLL